MKRGTATLARVNAAGEVGKCDNAISHWVIESMENNFLSVIILVLFCLFPALLPLFLFLLEFPFRPPSSLLRERLHKEWDEKHFWRNRSIFCDFWNDLNPLIGYFVSILSFKWWNSKQNQHVACCQSAQRFSSARSQSVDGDEMVWWWCVQAWT